MVRERRAIRTRLIEIVGLLILGLPSSSFAEDLESHTAPSSANADPSTADPAPKVHPPEPIEPIEAAYPEQARATGQEGRVVLRLTIDAQGRVTEAEVTEPAGHGFDESAREAAMRARFTPARRGEKPVTSRILYAYKFSLPRPPATGILAGRVLLPGQGIVPAAGVRVVITAPDGSSRTALTNEQGRFQSEALTPGVYDVTADAAGFQQSRSQAEVIAERTADATLRLAPGVNQPTLSVTVRGPSEVERLRRSAQAVHIIETKEARRQAADLGEVLARSEGVGVRRAGGLGSGARFSLNGLTGEQIRFFLDGVPLDLSGYLLGVGNVPVNLVERAEIYRGVVPVRFGADALGGAVNLVTDQDSGGTHASTSYQVGSFDTYRLALAARHLHEPSGFLTRVNGFLDYARNDYPTDVETFDESGRLSPARVHRFHDSYRAAGGGVEVGFVRRPWADRLLLRAFYTEHDRDVQHNVLMTVPYGAVTYDKRSGGAHLRYAQMLSTQTRLDAVAGYSYVHTAFRDLATCRYDWFGRCAAELPQPGEIDAVALDQVTGRHTGFARINLAWTPTREHHLRLGVSPTYATQAGDDRAIAQGDFDPLTARRNLLSGVAGAEYETRLFKDRLANISFVKGYLQMAQTQEQLPNGSLRALDLARYRAGAGDSLRFSFTDTLYAKASYEYTTRLPSPEELFGDGVLVVESLHLEPEASHNINLGVTLEPLETDVGSFVCSINGFGRFAENNIVLLSTGSYYQYENVFSARSIGVEAAAGWTSPGDWLSLHGHVTWQDFRNTSSEGAFKSFEGDRIPNRPYLFAGGSARVQWPRLILPGDVLSLTWVTRHAHEFFRGWESVGAASSKLVIPSQLSHALALTYLIKRDGRSVSGTLEVQNLTDAPVFDYFGVELPGRAAYAKLVLDL